MESPSPSYYCILGVNVDSSEMEIRRAYRKLAKVRKQSFNELRIFERRWNKAAKEDECWADPFPPVEAL